MMRKDWPFQPYIHQKIHFTNGKPDRMAATVILFLITPTGKLSKSKFYGFTCYENIVDDHTQIDQKDLINKTIERVFENAPPLKKGYTYSRPCVY